MTKSSSRYNWQKFVYLLPTLLVVTACGTLEVALDEPAATIESPVTLPISTERPGPTPAVTANPSEVADEKMSNQAVAWYGTIHSVEGAEPGSDYLKPWHLNIWPKFGPAVGITGTDPTINDEIERLRDKDIKATFWGRLICDVADYGACQLRVTRLSADDGGLFYTPERVEGWEGTIGLLPVQPGSQNSILYFVLTGEVPILYGIASGDPSIQSELERLSETGTVIHIWGELRSKAQPVTGSIIDVDRLEVMSP